MKLFQTNNIEVIRHVQCTFNFMLPSVLTKKNVVIKLDRSIRNGHLITQYLSVY